MMDRNANGATKTLIFFGLSLLMQVFLLPLMQNLNKGKGNRLQKSIAVLLAETNAARLQKIIIITILPFLTKIYSISENGEIYLTLHISYRN